MSQMVEHVIAWIVIWLVWLVGIPFSIYGITKLWQARNLAIMRKRHVKIVLFTLGSVLIHTCVASFNILSILIYNYSPTARSGIITMRSLKLCYPIGLHLFPWCVVWRCYQTYYDCMFAQSIIQRKWHYVIENRVPRPGSLNSHTNSNNTSNDIIKTRKTSKIKDILNRPYLVIKIITVLCISAVMLSYFMWIFMVDPFDVFLNDESYVTPGIALATDVIIIIFTYAVSSYFFLQTPDLYDIFLVKKETKYVLFAFWINVIDLVYYTATGWSNNYNQFENMKSNSDSNLIITWDFMFFTVFFDILPNLLVVYVCSFWIFNQKLIKSAVYQQQKDAARRKANKKKLKKSKEKSKSTGNLGVGGQGINVGLKKQFWTQQLQIGSGSVGNTSQHEDSITNNGNPNRSPVAPTIPIATSGNTNTNKTQISQNQDKDKTCKQTPQTGISQFKLTIL